ncbi:MAG: metal-dependent hydrolase [Gammaproteobacteria bacterium]
MASAFAHIGSAVAIGAVFSRQTLPRRFWWLGALCSVLPDLDIIGFFWGIPYAHVMGHRGFTHSLAFAALWSGLLVAALRCAYGEGMGFTLFLYFFLCTVSHGVLDAMTDGGLGVAFFAPWNNERYFLPWRPLKVPPIGIPAFFSRRGLVVLGSEVLWVGVPLVLIAVVGVALRRKRNSWRG